MKDLWPADIVNDRVISPVVILREQAALLAKKTQNLIKADVDGGNATSEDFLYQFYIVAPTLNNYHYRLFTIEHDIGLYPLAIYLSEDIGKEVGANLVNNGLIKYVLAANSENEFQEQLSKIFRSTKTKQVVTALHSQIDTSIQDIPY